jgi:CheY-like chemotaxis protein
MCKPRILVVEDHPATAHGLKRFLELKDYDVDVASDVCSALQLAPFNHYDVLVCDLNLPDGTGWDLMEQLSHHSPVRGIAFSAFDAPEDLSRSKAAGFLDHVVKGSGIAALLDAITRVTAIPVSLQPMPDHAGALS